MSVTIGWDIGGAHPNAERSDNARIVDAVRSRARCAWVSARSRTPSPMPAPAWAPPTAMPSP